MLTESIIVATSAPAKAANNTASAIYVHDLQPIPAIKATFKKSSANANCLAFNKTHIFAAQTDKAVIHVYKRDERENQRLELVVPFPEKISSIALAGQKHGAGILALGTENGRLILWELGTGRQVSTPQHHLQPVTCLVADLTSNFLISGSSDSSIHVWSLPGLLSFSASSQAFSGQDLAFSPLRSLSAHRTAIVAIAFGHSASNANLAVSASEDGTCIVWDFFSGTELHTYLLSGVPICLALDPIDRAAYVGFQDGSLQLIDFYARAGSGHPLHNPELQATPSQLPTSEHWEPAPGEASSILCLDVSYDGTTIISGHADGKVNTWDAARRAYASNVIDLSMPVTNLILLPPSGFPVQSQPGVKLHNVVKPRYESFAGGNLVDAASAIPQNYHFAAEFRLDIKPKINERDFSFDESINNPCLHQSLIDEAIAEFNSVQVAGRTSADSSTLAEIASQNTSLAAQLKSMKEATERRDREDWIRKQENEIKAARKKRRRLRRLNADEIERKRFMGEAVVEFDKDINDQEDDDLSSSTDEMSDTD